MTAQELIEKITKACKGDLSLPVFVKEDFPGALNSIISADQFTYQHETDNGGYEKRTCLVINNRADIVLYDNEEKGF